MDAILHAGRIIFVTLISFEIVLIAPVLISSKNKKEGALFVSVLLLLLAKTVFAHVFAISLASSLLLIYVAGNLLSSIAGDKNTFLWNISIGSISAIFAAIMVLRLTDRLYFPLFYSAAMAVAFIYPLGLMIKLSRLSRSPVMLYLIITSVLLILGRSCDLLSGVIGLQFLDMTLWSSICLAIGLGLLAVHEGHTIGLGFKSQELRFPSIRSTSLVFSRLVQTENTLLLQDRIAARGVLAMGAIHEFKNIIANIKTGCQYGIREESPDAKQASLEAVLENAEAASGVVRNYLEYASDGIEEERKAIDLKTDLAELFRVLGMQFRRMRISFYTEIQDGIRLLIGRGELEQIILNLVRNSSESLIGKEEDERVIRIKARYEDGYAIIDFSDTGRGVPKQAESMILTSRFSSKGSTGLGLTLVKLIVERNNGRVEYHPSERGACFRIILECED